MKEFLYNIKLTWKYSKTQKYTLLKYAFFNFLSVAINIIIPLLSSRLIINLTDNNLEQLILIGLVIFIVENIRNFIYYFTKNYSLIIFKEIYSKIEIELCKETLKLENKVIDSNSSGLFIQRLTNDTSKIADIFNILNMSTTEIISNIGIYIAIFIINKYFFLYFIATTIIIVLLTKKRSDVFNNKDKRYRKKQERLSGFLAEMIRGSKDIKMLNSEDSFIDQISSHIHEVNKDKYDMFKTNSKYSLLLGFVRDSIDLLTIILMIIMIKDGYLSVAAALVLRNYHTRIESIDYYIEMLIDDIKDFNLSSSRIFNIIDGNEFKKEHFGNIHLDKINGDFEFKNVDFSYDDKKVLDNLSFKVNANQTVGFVGKSGAGKTTLFNLLCKMYDVNNGMITIDGIDINQLDKDSIRGNITIISQNPYIFNLTIRENFELVKKDLTEEEMINACKLACLDDFINSLPDKYDTLIGEGGVNLSGGQKQRLAIARALIQKTEIILLDEATSALDNETQSSIHQAIDNMKSEYTIMIIAHRLSTIINCDKLFFMDEGKIIMEGSHKELLEKCEQYRNLYQTEISKE